MLSDKIQRIMMGTMLLLILVLVNSGETMIASYLLGFMIAMVYVWAFFDFCPSLWMLKKGLKEKCTKC
jgi:multisubunit Na+/H+ antiporter MnhE subunit